MLLEKRADNDVPRSERASLWLHLRYCPYCSRYAKQTMLIAEWASAAATAQATNGPALSAAAKERMRARLAAAG